jgi:hypothetical protein
MQRLRLRLIACTALLVMAALGACASSQRIDQAAPVPRSGTGQSVQSWQSGQSGQSGDTAPCKADSDCAVSAVRDVEQAGCCQPACVRHVFTAPRAAAIEAAFKARCSGSPSVQCPLHDCPAPPREVIPVCVAGRCTGR